MALSRKTRRGLLFGMTLFTIFMVVIGALFIGSFLESTEEFFVIYWTVCFVCAMSVLMLAFIDMRRVRQEFQNRQTELDAELAKIVADTEEMATQAEKNELNSNDSTTH